MSALTHIFAMLASPLSIMMMSVPLSSIYSKYTSIYEVYQMQLAMPENIRYVIYDNTEMIGQYKKLQEQEMIDVTEQINRNLGIRRST
jgi:hypothetical protein